MAVVLAPIDGSDLALRAMPWAAKLAGPGGTVVLLRVVPPQPAYADSLLALAGQGEDGVARIQAAWDATANADLDEAASALKSTGVTVEREIAAGEADEEIVAAAQRHKVDFIAMASHGRGAIGRAIFGSVADRVTRETTVPTLVLRAPDDDAAAQATIVPHRRPARRLRAGRAGAAGRQRPRQAARSCRCTSCARSTRRRRCRWRRASSSRPRW